MATTITPGIGQGCIFTAQGAGLSPGYSAIDLRRAFLDGAQEGVIAGNATEAAGWQVTQRGAGANNSCDIAANVACARVQGDSVTQQGQYTVAPHSAVINEAITSANATNPRIDQVVLEVLDNQHDGSGSSLARTRVIAGTASAGATLDNRTGAAALPSNCVRLADLLIPANAGGTVTLANNQIRDRRPWARGVFAKMRRTTDVSLAGTAAIQAIDTTNLQSRVECSGVPLRAVLNAPGNISAAGNLDFTVFVDAADGGPQVDYIRVGYGAASNFGVSFEWEWVPSAGSHTIAAAWAVANGAVTGSLYGVTNSSTGITFTVEELPRQNLANNTVTSG